MNITEFKNEIKNINESINPIITKLNDLRNDFKLYAIIDNKVLVHNASDSYAECLSRAIEYLEEAQVFLNLI